MQNRAFEYLLNAMEEASQHTNPAEHYYKDKREAVFAHVAALRAFQIAAEEIAVSRQKGYAERRHGAVVNGECADALVKLCQEYTAASRAAIDKAKGRT